MIKALVVDDEALGRDGVRLALEQESDVRIVAECCTGREAIGSIRTYDPDLVFLDVHMPDMSGFEVIEEVGVESMPGVIFITAFDEYAVQAFTVHAFDYLLKPFSDERFAEAVQQARRQLEPGRDPDLDQRFTALLRSFRDRETGSSVDIEEYPHASHASRILIREDQEAWFVNVADLEWISAAGNYVRLHLQGGATHLVRATIGSLEDRLDSAEFVRIHRSRIVNVGCIEKIQPWAAGDYLATLKSGTELKVSRTYREKLLRPIL